LVFERIVVALDGSEASEAALRAGAELAKRLGVPLHLLRVADIAITAWGPTAAAAAYAEITDEMAQEKREAEQYLASVAAPLRAAGQTVTTEVRSGPAVAELIAAVRAGDILAVGSHGRSGLKRLLLGSVAEEVVKNAPTPVLVARASLA
jgi:nucleotide-binding universal stress UspA family protein